MTKRIQFDSKGFRIREEGKIPYWSQPVNNKLVKRISPPSIIPEPRFKRDMHIDNKTGMLIPIMVQTNKRSIEAAKTKIKRNASYITNERESVRNQLDKEFA